MSKLTKIAEISLCGQTYHIAKNGNFSLVEPAGPDAYGTEIYAQFNIPTDGFDRDFCQALLDALGDALVSLRSSRDLHKGVEP